MDHEKDVVFDRSFSAITSNDLSGAFGHLRSYVQGSVTYDRKIPGLGAIRIDAKMPISEEVLGGLTVQQLQHKLLSWLEKAIREESLREWLESQHPETERHSDEQSPLEDSLSPGSAPV